jgi:hypothetical protein
VIESISGKDFLRLMGNLFSFLDIGEVLKKVMAAHHCIQDEGDGLTLYSESREIMTIFIIVLPSRCCLCSFLCNLVDMLLKLH